MDNLPPGLSQGQLDRRYHNCEEDGHMWLRSLNGGYYCAVCFETDERDPGE